MRPYDSAQPIANNGCALATSGYPPPAVVHSEMGVYDPYCPVVNHSMEYVAPLQLVQYEREHIPLGYDNLQAVTSRGLPAVEPGNAEGPTTLLVPTTANHGAMNISHYSCMNAEMNAYESGLRDSHMWVTHGQAQMHIPPAIIIPSNSGPPNPTMTGPHDCRSQLESIALGTTDPTSLIPVQGSLSTCPTRARVNLIKVPDRDSMTIQDIDVMFAPIVNARGGKWRCEVCEKVFRRKQRALLHYLNKHGGLRLPCNGVCGKIRCDKSFTCQEGLDVHLKPVEITCKSCGKRLLKKNILRHQRENCHPTCRGCAK